MCSGMSFPSSRLSAPEPVRYVGRSGDMRHTEYGPLAFGMSFFGLQPFEERAASIVERLFFVAQPFIPLQHPWGRVASVPRYCDGRYTATLQFHFGCLHQVLCHLTVTVTFAHPQRVDESVCLAIQRSVFGTVRNKHLYAAIVLLKHTVVWRCLHHADYEGACGVSHRCSYILVLPRLSCYHNTTHTAHTFCRTRPL